MNAHRHRTAEPQREVKSLARTPGFVIAQRYFYCVDLGDNTRPRYHYVDHQCECTCASREACRACAQVEDYLEGGGRAVEAPPIGYYPLRPAACPICGATTQFDQSLCSKARGAGWRCSKSGSAHYWAVMGKALAVLHQNNPWLFPPIQDKDGTVLYPGLLRAEVIS